MLLFIISFIKNIHAWHGYVVIIHIANMKSIIKNLNNVNIKINQTSIEEEEE